AGETRNKMHGLRRNAIENARAKTSWATSSFPTRRRAAKIERLKAAFPKTRESGTVRSARCCSSARRHADRAPAVRMWEPNVYES
ncbi:hypothetical protein, partial [Paraburkholderia xenovorans]|uniref:hypothetical protein n=1 Tax=Paraburkholderia xenovorans TaxID=36873 RepID=UPI0038B9A1F9